MLSSQLLLACLLALRPADDAPLTPAQRAELPQYFGFAPLQIYKLDGGIANLRLADLDHDGRTDVLLWNATRSRFEIFYQPKPTDPATADPAPTPPASQPADDEPNPIPDRGTLRNQRVPVPYSVASNEIADVTGDGRRDIVFFTTESKELVVLPGRSEGGFGAPTSIRAVEGLPRNGTLAVGDFNSDQRIDVALLGPEYLLLYYQKPTGGLAQPERLVHGIASPMLMLPGDLDGDGRTDLLIGADDERYGMYVALQEAIGGLAALRPIQVPRTRSLTVAPARPGTKGDDAFCVDYATGRLLQYRWELPADKGVAADWPLYLHSYPVKGGNRARPVVVGDITGDKLVDCIAADPDAAQLILFPGRPSGLGAGQAFPGLIKTMNLCLADLDGDGRTDLLSVSPQEKLIGVSHYEEGRLTFPTPVPDVAGEPFAAGFGSLTAGGKPDRLAYMVRDEREFYLVVPAPDAPQRIKIDDMPDDPASLEFVDLDQDGRNDILVFLKFAAPLAFLQDEHGEFKLLKGAEARTALLKEATSAEAAIVDVTGDGKPELLLTQGNLVRALRVEQGRWTVVDQYNPESANAELTGLAALPGTPGSPTLVMYDHRARELAVQKRGETDTYGVVQTMPLPAFELTAMRALPLPDAPAALMLADADKLAVLLPEMRAASLVQQHAYETEVKDAWLADAIVGDVNHDGVRDVALLDMRKASLELLTTLPDGDLVRALRFQVFQGKRFTDAPDSGGQPREALIGDVTGDEHDDIVLVVHDRLIVYPGH